MNLPIEIFYLLALLLVILLSFLVFKRPIYEAMFSGYLVMILLLGKPHLFFYYLLKPSTNTLFYAIIAFLSLAYIFTKTDVVRSIIDFLLALVGRFRGGAGYVSLLSSTFMAALSGTGPGNVAATGIFTIPTMIETGFPPALAASVEMSASSLGPMLPPSGTILLAFGVLETLYPGRYSLSKFWMVVWAVGLWFILQRFLSLYFLCRYYKVEPVAKEDTPKLGEVVAKGWKALLLPFIIFLPLYFDFKFSDGLITNRLGVDGAKAFSSSVILFTPGIAAVYALLISRKKINGLSPSNLIELFKDGVKEIVPVAATIYFAYAISDLFGDIDMGANLGAFLQGLGLAKFQLIIFFSLFMALLGMILPGSSLIAIFGLAIVASLESLGLSPIISAAVLPSLTGSLAGMTPPLALSLYAAMGIAGSSMRETSMLALFWVLWHLLVAILILLGFLPLVFS